MHSAFISVLCKVLWAGPKAANRTACGFFMHLLQDIHYQPEQDAKGYMQSQWQLAAQSSLLQA